MSKVSRAMSVIPGLVDPKHRPKGVCDGQQVNIPVLLIMRWSEVVEDASPLWIGVQAIREFSQVNPGKRFCLRTDGRELRCKGDQK